MKKTNKKKGKKFPTHRSSRENKNIVFSLSLFKQSHSLVLACFASACQPVPCKGRQYTFFSTWTKSSPKRCSCLQSPNIWAGAAQAAKLPLKIHSMAMQANNGLKLQSFLAAGAVNQPPGSPRCGWGRADLPTTHGKPGQATKKSWNCSGSRCCLQGSFAKAFHACLQMV